MLIDAIQTMYREIAEYKGDFGDPIDTGSYDPFDLLRGGGLSHAHAQGVGVAILCRLMTAIDNGVYEGATSSGLGVQARQLLNGGFLDPLPLVRDAAEAFFVSEAAFLKTLAVVYRDLVLPNVEPKVAG